MNIKQSTEERPVEEVLSVKEGRLAYIAEMAAELAAMASAAGEARLCALLVDASRHAGSSRKRLMYD